MKTLELNANDLRQPLNAVNDCFSLVWAYMLAFSAVSLLVFRKVNL